MNDFHTSNIICLLITIPLSLIFFLFKKHAFTKYVLYAPVLLVMVLSGYSLVKDYLNSDLEEKHIELIQTFPEVSANEVAELIHASGVSFGDYYYTGGLIDKSRVNGIQNPKIKNLPELQKKSIVWMLDGQPKTARQKGSSLYLWFGDEKKGLWIYTINLDDAKNINEFEAIPQ